MAAAGHPVGREPGQGAPALAQLAVGVVSVGPQRRGARTPKDLVGGVPGEPGCCGVPVRDLSGGVDQIHTVGDLLEQVDEHGPRVISALHRPSGSLAPLARVPGDRSGQPAPSIHDATTIRVVRHYAGAGAGAIRSPPPWQGREWLWGGSSSKGACRA